MHYVQVNSNQLLMDKSQGGCENKSIFSLMVTMIHNDILPLMLKKYIEYPS